MTGAPLVWVVGRGGLLGSHLAQALAERLPQAEDWRCTVPRFAWGDPARLAIQLEQAVSAFVEAVLGGGRHWMILWAAGAGVVGSREPELRAETAAWEFFLQRLDHALGAGGDRLPGLVFLASSAGGVYGDSPDQPLTEASPCRPISEYGRSKLRQEDLLRDWARRRPHAAYLIGRISNLYGPGQGLDKPQGLITQISRRLVYHHPVHIYVPLDTIRDYLFAADGAAQIAHCLAALARGPDLAPPTARIVKIFAAEQAASVAQIVGIFSRIASKQHPKLICAPSPLARKQPRKLEFHSIVGPDVRALRRTPLSIGIYRVHQDQIAHYRQGRLPVPWEGTPSVRDRGPHTGSLLGHARSGRSPG